MLSMIRKQLLNRKLYTKAEQSRETSHVALVFAAEQYMQDNDCTAEHWPYLRNLIEKGEVNTRFVLEHHHLFSLAWLLTCNHKALLEQHGRTLASYRSAWDIRFGLKHSSLTPEDKFQFLDLESEIDHAEYTTEAGVKIAYRTKQYPKCTYLCLHHPKGVSMVSVDSVMSFELFEDYLYLNGHKSKFELKLSGEDYECMQPFISRITKTAAANAKLHETRAINQETIHSNANRSNDSGLNPWIAGALGVGVGALTASAWADDE